MIEIDKNKPLTEGRFVEILNDRLGIKDGELPLCLVFTEKHLLDLLAFLFEILERSKRKGKEIPAVMAPKYKKEQQESKDSNIPLPKTASKLSDKWPDVPDRLIDIKEVCRRVGFAKPTIYKKVRDGEFPPPS